MALELFTDERYFEEEDTMVRLSFRNGTGESQGLNAFPHFGGSRFELSYADFVREFQGRSIVRSSNGVADALLLRSSVLQLLRLRLPSTPLTLVTIFRMLLPMELVRQSRW